LDEAESEEEASLLLATAIFSLDGVGREEMVTGERTKQTPM
jgi:hypothetical protein